MISIRNYMVALVCLILAACATDGTEIDLTSADSKAAQVNVQLGVGYMNQGKLQLADTKFRRALKQAPRLPVAHWTYALLQERLGEFEAAEKHFKKAVALDPKDSRAHNNYGVFLCNRGRIEEADQEFVTAVNNPLYQLPQSAYTNAGICALKIPDEKKAEDYFRMALSRNARYTPALLQMARLTYQRRLYLQTRAYLQRYTDVAKPNPGVLWLGYQTERQLGDYSTASSYALQLKNLFPESRETTLLLESERNGL